MNPSTLGTRARILPAVIDPARIRLRVVACLTVALTGLVPPVCAVGQQAAPPSPPLRQGISWTAVGISAVAIGAAFPLDGRMRTWVQGSARQDDAFLQDATRALTPFGTVVPVAAGALLYGFARAFDHPVLADEVWHSGEGAGVALVLSGILKVALHRDRPYVEPHDPGAFFQGPVLGIEGDHMSFPSGHTTMAFAVAGAAEQELEIHHFAHARLVGGALYAVAAGVAFSRVYDDVHWTSDVVAGAVLGTLVSRAVVWQRHAGDAGGAQARLLLLPGAVPMMGVRLTLPR